MCMCVSRRRGGRWGEGSAMPELFFLAPTTLAALHKNIILCPCVPLVSDVSLLCPYVPLEPRHVRAHRGRVQAQGRVQRIGLLHYISMVGLDFRV